MAKYEIASSICSRLKRIIKNELEYRFFIR